jgi:hypothetical protein
LRKVQPTEARLSFTAATLTVPNAFRVRPATAITKAGRYPPTAGFKVPGIARRAARFPWTESMHGPMVVMRVAVPITRKTVSVKGMEIAMRARANGSAHAAGADPTAVGPGINLSHCDTEEPGRSDGN